MNTNINKSVEDAQSAGQASANQQASAAGLTNVEGGTKIPQKPRIGHTAIRVLSKTASPFKGFLEFIRTQGVVGLAVGFILGGAISGVVASLVNDIINPVIGIVLGRIGELAALSLTVGSAKILYGKFLTVLINFLIVGAVVYFGVKKLGLDKIDKSKS